MWLPLNGDLKNQGLDGNATVVTTTNASFVNNGKVGKCLKLGYTNNIIVPSLVGAKQMSWAYWCRVDEATATNWLDPIHWYSAKADQSDSYVSRQEFYNNCTNTGVWYKGGALGKGSFGDIVVGAWNHFAFTIDYETGEAIFYINGNQVSKATTADTTHQIAEVHMIRFGENGLSVSENDIRIYDEILSPKVIKEISKGLVCHYTLSSGGGENLLRNTSFKDGSNNWSPNGGLSLAYNDEYNGQPSITLIPPASATNRLNIAQNCISQFSNINNLPQITVSFWYKAESGANNNGVGAMLRIANTNSLYNDIISPTGLKVDGEWHRYEKTVDLSIYNNTGVTAITFMIFCYSKSVSYSMIKLEKGSVATPWTPNPADLEYTKMGFDDGIEYDVSGYGHNGTKSGTITYNVDTPRYWTSTYFNGSSYISTEAGSFGWFNFDQCTISAWMKPTSKPSSYSGAIGLSHDYTNNNKQFSIANHAGIFVVYYNNGSYSNVSSGYELPLNEWHHCVAVLDGTTVKLYVDGILKKTQTIDWGSAAVASTGRIQVGVDFPGSDEKYTGYYSDARIYMTPLSEADILALYNTPISLTSNGTLLTQGELTEV